MKRIIITSVIALSLAAVGVCQANTHTTTTHHNKTMSSSQHTTSVMVNAEGMGTMKNETIKIGKHSAHDGSHIQGLILESHSLPMVKFGSMDCSSKPEGMKAEKGLYVKSVEIKVNHKNQSCSALFALAKPESHGMKSSGL